MRGGLLLGPARVLQLPVDEPLRQHLHHRSLRPRQLHHLPAVQDGPHVPHAVQVHGADGILHRAHSQRQMLSRDANLRRVGLVVEHAILSALTLAQRRRAERVKRGPFALQRLRGRRPFGQFHGPWLQLFAFAKHHNPGHLEHGSHDQREPPVLLPAPQQLTRAYSGKRWKLRAVPADEGPTHVSGELEDQRNRLRVLHPPLQRFLHDGVNHGDKLGLLTRGVAERLELATFQWREERAEHEPLALLARELLGEERSAAARVGQRRENRVERPHAVEAPPRHCVRQPARERRREGRREDGVEQVEPAQKRERVAGRRPSEHPLHLLPDPLPGNLSAEFFLNLGIRRRVDDGVVEGEPEA